MFPFFSRRISRSSEAAQLRRRNGPSRNWRFEQDRKYVFFRQTENSAVIPRDTGDDEIRFLSGERNKMTILRGQDAQARQLRAEAVRSHYHTFPCSVARWACIKIGK